MISGFQTIQSILGSNSKSPFLLWPSWEDFEEEKVPLREDVNNSIIDMLMKDRFCFLLGAQAHRKTITAKTVGFLLAKKDWAIWYSEVEHLDLNAAITEISQWDKPRILFILDDCHKDPDGIDFLLRSISTLKSASFLLTSRPTKHFYIADSGSVINRLMTSGNQIDLNIDQDLINNIIYFDFDRKTTEDNEELYGKLVRKMDIENISQLIGQDLEILNWILKSWNPNKAQPLTEVANKSHLYHYIISNRLNSSSTRKCLLPLSAMFQFEIPVQINYLSSEIENLISEGTVFVVPPFPGSQGVFVRLSHPSLAKIYLDSAEYHQMLDEKSASDYTFNQLSSYLFSKPANYYDLFRGLYNLSRWDLTRRLCAHKPNIEYFKWLSSQTGKSISRFSGLLGFICRVNNNLAKDLFEIFISSYKKADLISKFIEMDLESFKFSIHHLSSVDGESFLKIFSSITKEKFIDLTKTMPLEKSLAILQLFKKKQLWSKDTIKSILLKFKFDLIQREVERGISFNLLYFLFLNLKELRRDKFKTLLSSINLEFACTDKRNKSSKVLRYFIREFSLANLKERVTEMIEIIGEKKIINIFKKGRVEALSNWLYDITMFQESLSIWIIKEIGTEWFFNFENSANAETIGKIIRIVKGTNLEENFISVLDKTTLLKIANDLKTTTSQLLFLLEVLVQIDRGVSKIYAKMLMDSSIIMKIKRFLTVEKKELFISMITELDSTLAEQANQVINE